MTRYSLLIILATTILLGCGKQENAESLKAKLSKLKEQQIQLNHQIKELEAQLAKVDTIANGSKYIKVKVETLTPSTFNHFFIASGKVELGNQAILSAETNGQVKTINAQKGKQVRRGEIIVSLNTSILENSIAEVNVALELATKLYEKQKNLWEQNIGTELQYLQAKNQKESLEQKLKTLKSQLDLSYIKAPFDGIVDEVYVKEGELASPGKPIAMLLNTQSIKIEADVSESLLGKIRNGDKVKVEFPSLPELSMELPVNRVGNYIDPKTRTFKFELVGQNPNGKVKPNQIALLHINDYFNPKAITVPSIVIKKDAMGNFLFIAEKTDGRYLAKKVYVKTGVSYEDRTEVVEGLEANQNVIVAGYNMVTSGVPVQLVN